MRLRGADTDFVKCSTFHCVAQTGHSLVKVNLQLADRPCLAGYWKFSSFLLMIRNLRDRLESLVQRTLVGAITGNKWWGSLKHRIRNFTIKYGHQLNLDRINVAKFLEDKLSQTVEGGIPLP